MISIEINDERHRATNVRDKIERAIAIVLSDAGVADAEISVAIVDDQAIWKLNREFLKHDYPTDVLSFLLDASDDRLEGEIIASVDTAQRVAPEHGWCADHELLLYVVHGALHLAGLEDNTADKQHEMRRREREVLEQLGVVVRESSQIAGSASIATASGGSVS